MNLYNIRYHSNFFGRLADFVCDKIDGLMPHEIARSVILLPTPYTCKAFLESLKKRLKEPSFLPQTISFSSPLLTHDLPNATFKENAILLTILKKYPEYLSLEANTLLALSEDIYNTIFQLELSGLDKNSPLDEFRFTDRGNIDNLLEIKDEFKKQLKNAGFTWCAEGKIKHLDNILNLLDKDYPFFIAAGIKATLPKEFNIIRTIANKPNGYLVFHGMDSSFGVSKNQERILKHLGKTPEDAAHLDEKLALNTPIEVIEVKDRYAQAQIAAIITKETLIKNPNERIAIVINDDTSEHQVRTALSGWHIFPKKISQDRLLTSQFGQYAAALTQFLFKERSTLNMMAILNNKFSKLSRETFKELDLFIKFRKFITNNYLKILHKFDNSKNDPIINVLFELPSLEEKGSFASFANLHIDFLEKVSNVPHTFLQQFALFQKSFDADFSINPREYSDIFKAWLNLSTYRKGGDFYTNRIKVLKPSDAEFSKFNMIIFTDFNNEKIPGQRDNTLLTNGDRVKLGLPSNEGQVNLAFHQFIQHAFSRKCFVIRNTYQNGKCTLESCFISQLKQQNLARKSTYFNHLFDQLRLCKSVPCISRPMPRPPVEIRPTKLSVTEIGNMMRNPYFIYAKHILGLRKLNEFNIETLHSIKGQLIHKMMDIFISNYSSGSPIEFQGIVEASMDALMLEPKDLGFWMIKLDDMNAWFLDTIKSVINDAKQCYSEINGQLDLEIAGRTFTLLCLADRIDWLKDDTLSIIDYKTGTIPSMRDILSGFSPQLPLEGAIAMNRGFLETLPNKIRKIQIWRLNRANNSEIVTISNNPEKMATTCLKGFKQVMAKFFDEGTPYIAYPRPEMTINADPFYHLARVQEWIF